MTIESSEYTALKFKSEKIQEVNQWYNTLISAAKELIKYIKENFPTGPSFSFNGASDYQELINALSRETEILPKKVEQPQVQQQAQKQHGSASSGAGRSSSGAFKELFELLADSQSSAVESGIE